MTIIEIPGAKKRLQAGLCAEAQSELEMMRGETIKLVSKLKDVSESGVVEFFFKEMEATTVRSLIIIKGGNVVGYMNFKRPIKIEDGGNIRLTGVREPKHSPLLNRIGRPNKH